MNYRINSATLAFGISIFVAAAAHAGLLNSDGAEPVEVKHVEVEFNTSYLTDSSSSGTNRTIIHSTDGDITVTAGIDSGLDISFGLPYTFGAKEKVNGVFSSRTDGISDMTVDLKYQCLEYDGLKFAIKEWIILPTGKMSEGLSDGKAGYGTALIATREFAEGKYALHANAGYERHNYKNDAVKDATRHDIFTASIACEAEMAHGLKIAADLGLATNTDRASNVLPAYALVGLKYEFAKSVEGYAGIKTGLSRPEDDVAARFGIVLKF